MVEKISLSALRPANKEDFPWKQPFVLTDSSGKYECDEYGIPKMVEMELDKTKTNLMVDGKDIGKFEDVKHLVLVPSAELRSAFEFVYEAYEEASSPEKIRNYLDTPNWDEVTDRILDIVDKHQDYLCAPENLDQLAYIMMRWQNLYYCARIIYGWRRGDSINSFGYGENNPKYEIECITTDNDNQVNGDLIYDAWCVGSDGHTHLPPSEKWHNYNFRVLNERLFDMMKPADTNDEFTALLYKKNKTMDDWYKLLGDKRYEYHSIYQTRHEIDDHLLFVIGNGYDWNKDGFLCHDQPSGNDASDYGHYYCAKDKLRQDIKDELFAILDHPLTQKLQNDAADVNRKEYEEHTRKEYARNSSLYEILDSEDDEDEIAPPAQKELTEEEKKEQEQRTKEMIASIKSSLDDPDSDYQKRKKAALDAAMAMPFDEIERKMKEYYDKLMLGSDRRTKKQDRTGQYYPMCEYSAVCKMPKNVHPSYVDAGIRCLEEIVNNSETVLQRVKEQYKNHKDARSFVMHAEKNIKKAPKLIEKLKKLKTQLA